MLIPYLELFSAVNPLLHRSDADAGGFHAAEAQVCVRDANFNRIPERGEPDNFEFVSFQRPSS